MTECIMKVYSSWMCPENVTAPMRVSWKHEITTVTGSVQKSWNSMTDFIREQETASLLDDGDVVSPHDVAHYQTNFQKYRPLISKLYTDLRFRNLFLIHLSCLRAYWRVASFNPSTPAHHISKHTLNAHLFTPMPTSTNHQQEVHYSWPYVGLCH